MEGARAQPLSSFYHVNPNVNAANVNAERAEAFSTGWPMLRQTGHLLTQGSISWNSTNQKPDEETKAGRLKIQSRYFYRTQVYLGSDLWVQVSLTHSLTLVDSTDVSLVDQCVTRPKI